MRSFPQMIAQARVLEAQSVMIDQLTFVELPGDVRQSHTRRIGDALHHLKALISTGRSPIPVLLAHQINREGTHHAEKAGELRMEHLAESAEVERTVDIALGLWASRDDQITLRARLQTLASRRTSVKNWELNWSIPAGSISVHREVWSVT